MKTLVVIPARYASTRFPGKPLALIQGKSMIQRVYEQASQSTKSSKIIVATDDERIEKHVMGFGGNVCMTKENHPSGTDRCFEVWEKETEHFDLLVNVQGDEPFLAPEAIDQLIMQLQENTAFDLATLANSVTDAPEFNNPNNVKVVVNKHQKALYFSRAPIPFNRDQSETTSSFLKHVGIYGFRGKIIPEILKLEKSQLEDLEKLEQLRWLENGFSIGVSITPHESKGVDSPEDINNL